MAGLTATGFERPNLQELIDTLSKAFKDVFGIQLNTDDNSRFGQLIKVYAGRENIIWQAIEGVYNSQTLNGAEGIFLDELFALIGIFRSGETPSSGNCFVEVDGTALSTQVITSNTKFAGSNGITYASLNNQKISENNEAFKVITTDLVGGVEYSITITNNNTNQITSATITLASSGLSDRNFFITQVIDTVKLVNGDQTFEHDTAEGVLYMGFDAQYDLIGTDVSYDIISDFGNRYPVIPVVAETSGFNPLLSNSITSMTPTTVGFVEVTNVDNFFAGSEVETDAEFATRAITTTNAASAATRPALVNNLRANVLGLSRVRFLKQIVAEGSQEIVRISPLVIGGSDVDIANELYNRQAITSNFLGTTSVEVNTEDGDVETIRFTRATENLMNVRVTYKTLTGTALGDTEELNTIDNILAFSATWDIGSTIYNQGLRSSTTDALAYDRLTELTVEIKRASEPEGSYTELDFVPAASEYPSITKLDIEFVQELI